MSKCAWCGKETEIYKSGYCEDCYESIRSRIVKNKEILQNALEESKNPQADKDAIKKNVSAAVSALDEYKRRHVPFFKSDFRGIESGIYANIGEKPRQKSVKHLLMPAVCVVLVIALFWQNRTANVLSRELADANAHVETLTAANQTLQDKLDQFEKTAGTKKTVTLSSGNYVSGTDFTAGTYDIEAVSGLGNVYSDNAITGGGINAIMGVKSDDKLGVSEKEYSNIYLPEGTTLTVDGVKIKLSLVEAY